MVSAQLVSGSSYSSQTSASLAQYAYLYKYDMRNRCIGTKLPGCSWEYKVYDLADRLIFSQTGEQRKEVNGNLHCPMQWDANVSWVFVKTP